jgi:hypothetical protein
MGRQLKRVLLAATILSLCIYSQVEYSRRHSSIPEIIDDPDRFENVSFRSEGRAENVTFAGGSTRFELIVMGDSIRARYPGTFDLENGDHVIVYGILHMKEGFLSVTQLHVYQDIRRLYVLSFAGLALIVFLFLKDWRLSLRPFEWRWRHA